METEKTKMQDTENTVECELDKGKDWSDTDTDDAPDITKPFDPTQINISPKQDTLVNIIARLRNDEIDMNTEFQRHADLWNNAKMSRFIESILIRFPIPSFYFDASNDDKWLIVDGLQRLSSIKKFVIDKKLRLSGLEYLNEQKGKTFDELHRSFQRRIDECPITTFQIMPGTPDEVKYSVFRRINTGGLVLNNQEIRNAMAKPRERKFLVQLAADPNMVSTMGDQSKRMADQELVLRFIAFYTQDYLKSKKNIAAFLDEALKYISERTDAELDNLGCLFRRSLKYSHEMFKEFAFMKRSDEKAGKRRRKNATLFEVWTVCLAKLNDKDADLLIERREQVIEKQNTLLDPGKDFYRSISLATQKRDHVKIRYAAIDSLIKEVLDA